MSAFPPLLLWTHLHKRIALAARLTVSLLVKLGGQCSFAMLSCGISRKQRSQPLTPPTPPPASPSLKVHCNKIATAGIINELELQGEKNSFLIYETLTNWQPH